MLNSSYTSLVCRAGHSLAATGDSVSIALALKAFYELHKDCQPAPAPKPRTAAEVLNVPQWAIDAVGDER